MKIKVIYRQSLQETWLLEWREIPQHLPVMVDITREEVWTSCPSRPLQSPCPGLPLADRPLPAIKKRGQTPKLTETFGFLLNGTTLPIAGTVPGAMGRRGALGGCLLPYQHPQHSPRCSWRMPRGIRNSILHCGELNYQAPPAARFCASVSPIKGCLLLTPLSGCCPPLLWAAAW